MKTEQIDKICNMCGEEAIASIKTTTRSLELCKDCAKDLLWELTRESYEFEE